jgi:hypothetical protein
MNPGTRFLADLRTALVIAWLIVSAVLFTAAAAPFLVPANLLYAIFPACEAARRGAPCVLCGRTTAFIEIAKGDTAAAVIANRFSITLWLLIIVNFTFATTYLLLRDRLRWRIT